MNTRLLALLLAACAVNITVTHAQGVQPVAGKTFHLNLRPALNAERRFLELPGFGVVAYYASEGGTGRPLVLTHSINAAPSAYEMKPIFEYYAGKRPVYALEWPGFGSSERPDVKYTPELITSALSLLLDKLGQDVDVVSLSLGSEFAARAALDNPRIKSLALISPTGLGHPEGGSQQAQQDGRGQELYQRLDKWRGPLYGLLRSPLSLHYFLGKSFVGPVDKGLLDYAQRTTSQPGAVNAPLYFISGQLFTADAYNTLYAPLKIPVLVLYDKDPYSNFDRLSDWQKQGNVKAVRIAPSKGLPQFEKTNEVGAALDEFWSK